MGNEEKELDVHESYVPKKVTPYEKHLEKYLKYKAKYVSLKNQSGGGESHNWQDENKWTNKSGFKKCMKLSAVLGNPNYVSTDNGNMIESIKWQNDLESTSFNFGAIRGVDMVKINNYKAEKLYPYKASVYVIVGKFLNVPDHLMGPLKFASETINMDQLAVPREINQEYVKNNVKSHALVTGSCASVTISVITLKFVEDMVARDRGKSFNDVNQALYEEYRAEYGKRISNYLCGNGIVPSISWYNANNFDENPKMNKIDTCKK
jgi:hypothetical protein